MKIQGEANKIHHTVWNPAQHQYAAIDNHFIADASTSVSTLSIDLSICSYNACGPGLAVFADRISH